MTHAQLPAEIWLHVAQSLDDELVRARTHRLHEVSSVFLQVALDRRYRALKVTDITPRSIQRIERLGDPAIAPRVRSLTLAPHLTTARVRGAPSVGHGAAMSIFGGLVGALLRPTGPPTQEAARVLEAWQRAVVRVLPLLSALDTLGLETDTLDPALDLQPLVACAWRAPGAHVTELRLQASPAGFAALLADAPRLPALERLRLAFINGRCAASDAVLTAHVAPFVNLHAGRLRALRVHFWTCLHPLDMAPLFDALAPLPALHTFGFHAPYAAVIRSDAAGLVRLLCSPALRTVYLCGSGGAARARGPPDDAADSLLASFVARLAEEGAALRSVSTLDICAATSPGGLPAFRKLLACLAPTLGTLRVREYDLTADELQGLVSALAGSNNITSLALNMRTLTAGLFDVLYANLPGLRKLTLNLRDAMLDPEARARFCEAMNKGKYEQWRLEELDIRNRVDAITLASLKRAMPCSVVTSLGAL